jgi:hypothetical protein
MLCHVKAPRFKAVIARPLTVLLLCLAAVANALAGGGAKPFLPDAEAGPPAVLHGSTWVQEGPAYVIRLQRIGEAQRLAYIEKVTGLRMDPFASPPDKKVLPQAYRAVRAAIMESTQTISGGEAVHGLLIYREVEPNDKSYRVDVQLALPSGDTVRFSAPYRRMKKKK